jgi:ribosome recycling factor
MHVQLRLALFMCVSCRFDFPKDTKKDLEDSVQKTTDAFVKKLDDMVKAKTDDIMKV